MLTKTELKSLKKLKEKKFREIDKKFIAEGKRLLLEGLESQYVCKYILITNQFDEDNKKFVNSLKRYKNSIEIISEKEFQQVTSTKNPQGIAGIFELPENENTITNEDVIIILENISDPGNLGTILRSCDWFGCKSIILSEKCADVYNPKVVRASMGAIFNLNIIQSSNLLQKVNLLKSDGYKIHIADMSGTNYQEVEWRSKSVIVFCNEANGPSNEIKQICDETITIPKAGTVESLNVAAAAAVILSTIPNS